MLRKCLIGVGVLAILVGVFALGVYLAQKGYIPGFEVAKTEKAEETAQKDEKKDIAKATTSINQNREVEEVELDAAVVTEVGKFGDPKNVKVAAHGGGTLVFKVSGVIGCELHLGQVDTGFAGTVNGCELIVVTSSRGGFATRGYHPTVFIPYEAGKLGTPQVPNNWDNGNGYWSYSPSGAGFFLVSKAN